MQHALLEEGVHTLGHQLIALPAWMSEGHFEQKPRLRMSSEQEQVEIYINEDVDVSQRSWLVAKLEHERGIIGAWFEGGDHHRLTVHYEPERFSHLTLLDTIKQHGFHGEIAGT